MTTLFQGKEDGEPKAHQITYFGSFLFDAKKSKTTDVALSIVAHLPVKLIFEGDNFLMKTEKISREVILVLALLYSTGIQRYIDDHLFPPS
jgi:hypothetical protein